MPDPPLFRVLNMRSFLTIGIIIILFFASAGCTGTPGAGIKTAYSVDNKGILSVTCAPATISEEVLFSNETYTKTRIVLHTQSGDVVTYVAAPKNPKAVIVYAPGAGEKITGHEERMVRYAAAGYAFMFVDTRGNGAETPGVPFSPQMIQQDYSRFEKGDWPQYVSLSMRSGQRADDHFQPVLSTRLCDGIEQWGKICSRSLPGVDPKFAGYVGISTSDWGLLDSTIQQGYSGDLVRFATSVEPSTYFTKNHPAPGFDLPCRK